MRGVFHKPSGGHFVKKPHGAVAVDRRLFDGRLSAAVDGRKNVGTAEFKKARHIFAQAQRRADRARRVFKPRRTGENFQCRRNAVLSGKVRDFR